VGFLGALLGSTCILLAAADADLPRFDVPRIDGIVIDGEGADWADGGFAVQALCDWPVGKDVGDGDARFRLAWDQAGLLVLGEVNDQEFVESDADQRLWEGDGIELFVFTGQPQPRFYTLGIAPGRDSEHRAPRWHAYDTRDEFAGRQPIAIEQSIVATASGYRLEARLPWANLGIEPRPGLEVKFQLSVNDLDSAGEKVQARWYPEIGADAGGRRMHVLRLAQEPSPPQRLSAIGSIEDFRYLSIAVIAQVDQAGQSVELRSGNQLLATGSLASDRHRARAVLVTPLPPAGELPVMQISSGGQTLVFVPPDMQAAKEQALADERIVFRPFAFTGSTLPAPQFERPGLVRDLIGPFALSVRYFDADLNEVTSAEKPGRFGAIVQVLASDGRTWRRKHTLFARSSAERLDGYQLTYRAALPPEAGFDARLMTAHELDAGELFRDLFVEAMNRDDGTAELLAALHESQPDEPADAISGTRGRNERYWNRLDMKLGDIKPLQHLAILPQGYEADADRRWPVMIYLHGNWPRSDDTLEIPQKEDLVKYIQANPQPMIVLAPQCPAGRRWSSAFLRPWLDKAMTEFRIDPDRVYLVGGSMGGWGAYLWAAEEPELFAAVVPVCGGADPLIAPRLKSMPLWAFHGDKDDAVPIALDEQIIKPLRALGAPVKFTVFPGVGHGVGPHAYATPGLWEWLLDQRRQGRP
jgi:hypothetical protein